MMFNPITFYINENRIEYQGESFLLGELTTDILNISPDEFKTMYDISMELKTNLQKIKVGSEGEEFDRTDELAAQLHSMLLKRKLLSLVAASTPFDEENPVMDNEVNFLNALITDGFWRSRFEMMERDCEIVEDIFAFNQTIFRFIDHFLFPLKKLDTENYAFALYDFYNNPHADKLIVNYHRDEFVSFNMFDEVMVRYEPKEVIGSPEQYAIYEVYTVDCLQGFLKMDFMKALMTGHLIRRCKNCKRFFLLTKGYHTIYCDRPLPENPKRNCRSQGAKNGEKERANNNPKLRSYNRASERIRKDFERGNITEDEAQAARNKIKDLRDIALMKNQSDKFLEDILQPQPLYSSLGIIRKNRK